jgi:hypothetical protein
VFFDSGASESRLKTARPHSFADKVVEHLVGKAVFVGVDARVFEYDARAASPKESDGALDNIILAALDVYLYEVDADVSGDGVVKPHDVHFDDLSFRGDGAGLFFEAAPAGDVYDVVEAASCGGCAQGAVYDLDPREFRPQRLGVSRYWLEGEVPPAGRGLHYPREDFSAQRPGVDGAGVGLQDLPDDAPHAEVVAQPPGLCAHAVKQVEFVAVEPGFGKGFQVEWFFFHILI